jgi:hypothetical protein
MSKKIVLAISLLLITASAFALSRHDARVAKERMTRCQHNDAVCAGNVLIDAMVAAGNNHGGNRPPNFATEKAVAVHTSVNCQGSISKIVTFKTGQINEALKACETGNATYTYGMSTSIDGLCVVKSNSATVASLCQTGVINANAEMN